MVLPPRAAGHALRVSLGKSRMLPCDIVSGIIRIPRAENRNNSRAAEFPRVPRTTCPVLAGPRFLQDETRAMGMLSAVRVPARYVQAAGYMHPLPRETEKPSRLNLEILGQLSCWFTRNPIALTTPRVRASGGQRQGSSGKASRPLSSVGPLLTSVFKTLLSSHRSHEQLFTLIIFRFSFLVFFPFPVPRRAGRTQWPGCPRD